MQPAYENVALHSAWEIEVAQGNVKDVAIQIGAAFARNTSGDLIQQRQHHGNVMRGKAPKDVLLRPYLPDVETVGIQIVYLSQHSLLDQILQLHDGGMISQN